MNYGTPKGGMLTLTGLTTGQQIAVVLSAIILITAIAVYLRRGWRGKKDIGDK